MQGVIPKLAEGDSKRTYESCSAFIGSTSERVEKRGDQRRGGAKVTLLIGRKATDNA